MHYVLTVLKWLKRNAEIAYFTSEKRIHVVDEAAGITIKV